MCRDRTFLVLSLLCLFFLWSSNYTAISFALKDFSPIGLALFRFLIASFFLLFISVFKKVRLPDRADVPLILLCGVLGISSYNILLIYGQKSTSVGLTSIILNTYPIFVAIFSSLFFKEIITVVKWLGIIISFCGIIVVSFGNISGFAVSSSIICLLLGAMVISLFDLEQKHLMLKYKPFDLTCYLIWSGTLSLLIFSPNLVSDLSQVSTKPLISAVYLGAFPSVLSYIIWAKLIVKYSVSTLSCCCFFTPFFAMLVAFIFLKQVPELTSVYGGIIVLLGVVVINYGSNLLNHGCKLKTSLSQKLYACRLYLK